MNGGTTQELSPEWMPASSMCSMMPPMTTAPVASAMASTSNSNASSRNLSISTGCSGDASTALRHVAIERGHVVDDRHRRGRRARTTAARRPGSRSRPRPRALPRATSRCRSPAAGCPSSQSSCANRSRSSARSIESGDVPRIVTPAACSASASFSGVWPPNCTRHDDVAAGRPLASRSPPSRLRTSAARSTAGRPCRSRSTPSPGCS